MLQHLAVRLLDVVGTDGLVAPLGGDEVAVVVTCASSRQDVSLLASRLSVAVQQPIRLAATELELPARLGLSLAPDPRCGDDEEPIPRRSDK
jgi:GGDEF domain-containing protein